MMRQTKKSESDVRAQMARVKKRRLSLIGFEEVNPSDLEFGVKLGEGETKSCGSGWLARGFCGTRCGVGMVDWALEGRMRRREGARK